MSRYIMFVCVDGDPDTDPSPEPDIEKWVADHDASGKRVGGDRLGEPDTATIVKLREGKTLVTDGPFTEGKEFIVGFDLLECDSMDEAIAIAAAHPMARAGRIEVREGWPMDLDLS